MLTVVEEYEMVKSHRHPSFKYARDFFEAKNVCFQNFYKFYNRFLISGRDPQHPFERLLSYFVIKIGGLSLIGHRLTVRSRDYGRPLMKTL